MRKSAFFHMRLLSNVVVAPCLVLACGLLVGVTIYRISEMLDADFEA